jgi:4-amino-4-deoxy-L-arabinose transferase-like glycosyltransferase
VRAAGALIAVTGADPREAARALLTLIVLSALGRLLLAAGLGLSVDESYTVAISRRLALSYFDHPPLHVWIVGVWARLIGSEQPLLLRLPDIAMFAVSTWLLCRLTASAYGERAGLWAALAFNLAPVFTLNTAGGIVPDGPLVLFALLAARLFQRALTDGTPRAPWRLLGAGAAAGLALLSKYLALFPILGFGVYLATCRPRWLAQLAPWLAALIVVALFTPVLAWNEAHGWVSFAFQGGRALPSGFSLTRALAAFAGQLLYLLPWTGVALLWELTRAVRRGPADEQAWLFACLAAPAIAVFAIAALWTKVLPHWPAIGWLFAFPLLGARLAALAEVRPRLLRAIALASGALLLGVLALVAWQTGTGGLGRLVPALSEHDPTVDLLDWRELAIRVRQEQQRRGGFVIATVSWIDAGKADYALHGALPVLCLATDARQFAFMRDRQDFSGADALIVADAARPDYLALAAPYFRVIVPQADVVIARAGRPALTLHTAYGYGLRPPQSNARPIQR